MDIAEFRRRGHETVERIARYYEELETKKEETLEDVRLKFCLITVLSDVQPGYLAKLLPTEAPEGPESFDLIAKDFDDKIMQGITHWQSPNFFAFYPANSSFPGILGDMYSDMVNCIGFNWQCSPACTELETIVLDWMAKAIGLDDSWLSHGAGGGSIQGTASEAVAVVLIAARQRKLDELRAERNLTDEEVWAIQGKLIAYGSTQTHSCTKKAATIANVRFRTIDVDADSRLRGETVRSVIEEDLAAGLIPFYLTVTIGTTSTGATDAIPEIVDDLRDLERAGPAGKIWVHVDAAYAGSALVCEEFRSHAAGVDGADSFDFNMHKWMLTNFDCSLLWVKERRHLLNALSITPVFLRNSASDAGLVTDYRDWQLPLGRRFRALKIWFVVRSYGLEGIRAHIRRHVALAHRMADKVRSRPDLFEMATGPNFALITFRVVAGSGVNGHAANGVEAGAEVKRVNVLTKKVFDRVNEEGRIFLTHTIVHGKDLIRFVPGSPWTEEKHIDSAFEVIVKTVTEVSV
ncbi:hypothetical protein HK101_002254 [Irineochytrium annulatum]|nr:hypothetical protein HK101_002254 [Irineochytrium annulatum]